MTVKIREQNPFNVGIEEIWLVKYDGSDPINITPQFLEINIFQNLFTTTMVGELLLVDSIGLFVNYPLTGEENIIITFREPRGSASPKSDRVFDGAQQFPFGTPLLSSKLSRTFFFVITNIRDIVPTDDAREASYVLELASQEFLESMRTKISHNYVGKIGEVAKQMYFDYINLPVRRRLENVVRNIPELSIPEPYREMYVDTLFDGSKSIDYYKVVIPNLYFFQAMKFLRHKALANDSLTYSSWVTFENLYGYFFTTIQSIIKDQIENFGDNIRNAKYLYNSNFEIIDGDDPDQLLRLISRYTMNKRFSSMEKIAQGYFRNQVITAAVDREELYVHQFPESDGVRIEQLSHLGGNALNTRPYREVMEAPYDAIPVLTQTVENSPKTKYILETISEELRNLYHTPANEFELRRQRLSTESHYVDSLNQVDITIVVPADIALNVGQVIYVELPELHGFNKIDKDRYITGYFLITELKHTIAPGGAASTVLRINKDSFANELEQSSKYNLNTGAAIIDNRTVIDPATGQPETFGGE